MSLSKPFVDGGKGEDVKLTAFDVAHELQGALTLISAYILCHVHKQCGCTTFSKFTVHVT